MIGKTLGHYEVVGLLGKGGMGEVFQARDRQLERDVALKFLHVGETGGPTGTRRFEREAKVLAALEHPNIASVYGLHEAEGMPFIAMEFLAGGDLEADVVEGGLPLDRLLEIGIPLADAMAHAHENGVVHRDLKPANIMRDASGRIRVLDFGLAGLRGAATGMETDATIDALTSPGMIVGTVAYMAPEQLEGQSVDARTDVFTIGVILFELATGLRPFQGGSSAGIVSAILRDPMPPLLELRPDLPADLARVIRRCLAKKADKRLQTARDICSELEEIQAGVRTDPGLPSTDFRGPSGHLVEKKVKIKTEHVRQMSTQNPRLVGDSMTYLDNGKASDALVICLNGIGSDQRDFEGFLREAPCRTVAISLYGFGPTATNRIALPIADHNILVAAMVERLCSEIRPKTLILVGHSSGSDQLLQISSSPEFEVIRPDGLILLGPAVVPGDGRISGPYSKIPTDPGGAFETIRTISGFADNLDEWLIMHGYLIRAFEKFGKDPTALQHFAETYIASLGEDTFFESFRTVVDRVKYVRCIFGRDDIRDSDRALQRHISDNALGDRYSEEMITTVKSGHMELKEASVVLPFVEEIIEAHR